MAAKGREIKFFTYYNKSVGINRGTNVATVLVTGKKLYVSYNIPPTLCLHTKPLTCAVTCSCRKRQKCDSRIPGCDRGPRQHRCEALGVYSAAPTTFLTANYLRHRQRRLTANSLVWTERRVAMCSARRLLKRSNHHCICSETPK